MHGMSFHWGFSETILFHNWKTTNLAGIIGSMIGIILLGMIYEALKNYREYLNVNKSVYYFPKNAATPRDEAMISIIHVVQAFLQGVQIVIGYFLMFIFMTYNVYLCVAVVAGSMLGYFIFAWKTGKCDISECCS